RYKRFATSAEGARRAPIARTELSALLAFIVEDDRYVPIDLLRFVRVGEAADRPAIASLDHAAAQQRVGFVQQRHEPGAQRPLQRCAAHLADQVERLLQCADQVTLLQPP